MNQQKNTIMKTIEKNITVNKRQTVFKKVISQILIAGFTMISLISCEKDDSVTEFQSNAPIFDIDLFEENLINYVNAGGDAPVGWAYTISKNGNLAKSDAFGKARIAIDGNVNFTLNKEINIASVSKFYTAIAAMQLLEANNLTIEDKINEWLPDSWTKGPGISELTFKDLLKHESGLQSTNNNFDTTLGYEGLKTCIQTGVVNATTRNYLNVNFALFRVLIPSLWSALEGSPAIDIENDANTQFMYLLYMQENIFDRLSLPLVGCFPEDRETSTLYYNVNDPANSTNGQYYGSWNNKSGGGGYFMTTLEMAKVNAYFEHTEILVSKEQRDIMKLHRLGMDNSSASNEIHGKYYGKAGGIGTSSDPSVSQGVQTQIQMFPINGIDCVVVMNCQGVTFQGTTSLRQLIFNAFNDAWIQP